MKKVLLSMALGLSVMSMTACSNASANEVSEDVVEAGSSFDSDVKLMADSACKVMLMMFGGEATTESGEMTPEFEKMNKDIEALNEQMEKKYKSSGEWDKFEKATQELVDKCGK